MTPLVVGGVMYLSAPATLYALDATTGASIWTLELESAHPSVVRGPTYADGKIYMYNGSTLVAADAETGELIETFGNDGVLPIVGAALQEDADAIGVCLTQAAFDQAHRAVDELNPRPMAYWNRA